MMRTKIPATAAAAALLLTLTAAPGWAATYDVDATHSSIAFKVRHLLTKTTGRFGTFGGTVEIDPETRETVKVNAWADTASIDTDDEDRDKHLRNADFFDAEKFPKITFEAGTLSEVNEERTAAKLSGTLTMHGVTKPVVLDIEWYGTTTDPWGNKKAGFAGSTKINRKDFGIVWNKTLDAGGLLIGEEVEIEINVEANLSE